MTRHLTILLGGAVLFVAGCEPLIAQEARFLTLLGIRSATVAPGGLAFAGMGLSSQRLNGATTADEADASGILGFGLGDAATGVGLQFSAHITSFTDDFGDSGYLSVKASRRVDGGGDVPAFIGVSVENLAPWGDSQQADVTTAVMATAFPRFDVAGASVPMMVTLGFATDVTQVGSDPGAFFGLGVGLTRNLGASVAWTGETVSLGAGFRLEGLDGVTFGAQLDDAFDQNDSRRLTLTATWSTDTLFGG